MKPWAIQAEHVSTKALSFLNIAQLIYFSSHFLQSVHQTIIWAELCLLRAFWRLSIPLHRCRKSDMASQITRNSTVCLIVCSGYPMTCVFHTQRVSYVECVSISSRHNPRWLSQYVSYMCGNGFWKTRNCLSYNIDDITAYEPVT